MTDQPTAGSAAEGVTEIVAKTLSGLEDILAAEMSELGAENIRPARRAVTCRGDRAVLYRLSLWCRCATRLLVPIHTAQAYDSDQLYAQVAAVDWSRHLAPDQDLAVDATVASSRLNHSRFVAQTTKDAVVDQLRRAFGRRPSVNRRDPDLRINVHLVNDRLTVSKDASGEPLSHRGYRREAGAAPLNEALAAGIIKMSDWNRRSPFVDGMCGSGTLAIEAAMMARKIAPGLNRTFSFMNWPDYDASLWQGLVDDAEGHIVDEELPAIVGGDIDAASIEQAQANARRAGVGDSIRFVQSSFEELDPPAQPGAVIMNPPYGERLKTGELEKTYRAIGDTLKQRYAGWTAWILTGNLDAAKRIGLRPSQRRKLYNPPLECRLLRFEMYSGSRKHKSNPD